MTLNFQYHYGIPSKANPKTKKTRVTEYPDYYFLQPFFKVKPFFPLFTEKQFLCARVKYYLLGHLQRGIMAHKNIKHPSSQLDENVTE